MELMDVATGATRVVLQAGYPNESNESNLTDNASENIQQGSEEAVETVSEWDTSKTCLVCGTKADSQRVERGLYDCDECGTVGNADTNGAEKSGRKVPPSPRSRIE